MQRQNYKGRKEAQNHGEQSGASKRQTSKGSGPRVGKSRPVEKAKPRGENAKGKPPRKFYVKGKPVGRPVKTEKSAKSSSEGMRLNRFIANAGVCSRREADTYIEAGVVTINGKIVTTLGTKVMPGDEVRFDDKIVMDLVKEACDERIYPVGRLDRNTTGLLLFTNDGDLSRKLTHPSHNMKKIYQATLDKPLTKTHLEAIAEGFELEDGFIAADAISFVDREDKTLVGIEIHSGKNRIVRRIFEHFGYRVRKLDRVLFAGLTKKNLPRGKWRFLSEKEVKFLKMI